MTKKSILCIDFASKSTDRAAPVSRRGLDLLRAECEVDWLPLGGRSREEILQAIRERITRADAVVLSPWCQFPYSLASGDLDRSPNLKAIAGTFDNRFSAWVDIQELQSRGITLIDTSRNMTPTVAEFAFAQTLNLIRDIPAMIERVRGGLWQPDFYSFDNPPGGFVNGDLAGRRIGLAGFGSINRRYAEFARAFGCDLMACDPFVPDADLEQAGVRRVDALVELARQSEIFMIGIPPTPKTEGIIDAEAINALPKGSLFILVTRMAVVEQDALWARIEANELRAAIDVFAPEPPPADAWFRGHPNVLASPHIAGGVFYCHERCFTSACQDLLAALRGERPIYAAGPWDAAIYEGRPVVKG